MDQFQKELSELKQFVADLKADRAATKEKEKREAWTKYVSLTVVILAVIAAIASQWAGKYGSRVLAQLNDATFNQTQASDQWAFYQAKSLKQKVYEVGRDQLTVVPAAASSKDLIEHYKTQIADYKKEQKDIEASARDFETKREAARKNASIASEKGGKMGLAVSFFSVSIAMASICMVTKKKPLWFLSMILGGVAVFEMVQAWMR